MEAPAHIVESLRNIRPGFDLRWNPRAVMVAPGSYDVLGGLTPPVYDPRWELWDTNPYGEDYMVMRLQNEDGSFRPPGEWLVQHVWRVDPARYGGDLNRLMDAVEAEADKMRDLAEKDWDDLAEAAAKWCVWVGTPKSGSGLSYRGQRTLAPGLN